MKMEIIDKIRRVRKDKKISQKKIAELLNLTQSAYSEIEQKRSKLRSDDLYKICDYLDIDLYDLIEDNKIRISLSIEEAKVLSKILQKINDKINLNNTKISANGKGIVQIINESPNSSNNIYKNSKEPKK